MQPRRMCKLAFALTANVAATVAAMIAAPVAALAFAPASYAANLTSLTIEGPGLAKPRTVVAAADPELFANLLAEVNWLATGAPDAPEPDPAFLGPAYQMVIRVDARPSQLWVLYPLAKGGPRVLRPAEQPDGQKVTPAWYYGRIAMPDTLRDAGVPLPTGDGGQGGGAPVGGAVITPSPRPNSLDGVVTAWQRQMVLLTAGAIALLLLLGTYTRLVRKP